ncbi:MAG: bifunctional oligoribonuclease/PAP phosphatase NrnA [Spirochaetaceae bacterium]|jgi:phosphoesterase RecJ-like protein|nr:bifunctional oligoribonuclease/PAP phosphatase NrnA [Spirochaetaceae bacterium]
MMRKALDFIQKHCSFLLTTHDGADADGIGAEILLKNILEKKGKTVRIIHDRPVPDRFLFMLAPQNSIEVWDREKHAAFAGESAFIMLDTSDEYNIGKLAEEALPYARGVLIIDHHELNPLSSLDGYVDSKAASTSEMILRIGTRLRVGPDREAAAAAFAGIVYDTGSFAYMKTSASTFLAAARLIKAGAKAYDTYQALFESASAGALLLQKQVLSTLTFHGGGRVAVQILRKEDLSSTGASFEDAENFINLPLRSREVMISLLIKENETGLVRCSLRSKGQINVSKIAQTFNGGGHATAAGFKSKLGIEDTLAQVLSMVEITLSKL